MYIPAGLILGVVVINIVIGLMQEGKAEKAADAIKAMLSASAMVIRGGKRFSVDADLLVPGDIVTIKSGDRLPADIRLLELSNLQVLEVRTEEEGPLWKGTAAYGMTTGCGCLPDCLSDLLILINFRPC